MACEKDRRGEASEERVAPEHRSIVTFLGPPETAAREPVAVDGARTENRKREQRECGDGGRGPDARRERKNGAGDRDLCDGNHGSNDRAGASRHPVARYHAPPPREGQEFCNRGPCERARQENGSDASSRLRHGTGNIRSMRTTAIMVVCLVAFSLPITTQAHDDVTISICIPYHRGGECARGRGAPSYLYGQRVPVKGRVRPTHGGVVKIQRRKGTRPWRTVARVHLDGGRYRYEWQTRRRHADQDTPYRFRSILPNHDVSQVQKVYVLYGE